MRWQMFSWIIVIGFMIGVFGCGEISYNRGTAVPTCVIEPTETGVIVLCADGTEVVIDDPQGIEDEEDSESCVVTTSDIEIFISCPDGSETVIPLPEDSSDDDHRLSCKKADPHEKRYKCRKQRGDDA